MPTAAPNTADTPRCATPRALIADDEPLLAAALQAELALAWPELEICAVVGDGASAVRQALAMRPDVMFLDIRMPGLSGLEAAADLADAWDGPGAPGDLGESAYRLAHPPAATAALGAGWAPFPATVFVTAYDRYALDAFEAQAVDYLLKPIQPERLARTVQRLQALLALRLASSGAAAPNTEPEHRLAPAQGNAQGNAPVKTPQKALLEAPKGAPENGLDQALEQGQAPQAAPNSPLDPGLERSWTQLRALLAATASAAAPPPPLRLIQASVGTQIRLLPVEQVLVFEAADKYVRVLTADQELLIRTPLKELLPQLDSGQFWQIHRGTVVRSSAIHSVGRDASGRLSLTLDGRPETWPVSRLYAGQFKAM